MGGKDLLTEMKTYVTEEANTAAEADAENTLPFESIDDYSTDPVSFSEMSLKLMDVVETVFDLAAVYNRRSPEYLKSCAQLERGIRYLGSCCLTKAALETKKHPLPDLGQLSTDKLYGMASFHFRKLDRALHEYIDEKHAVDDDLLEMEYRFFHLLQRLRSTEVKIYTYDFRRCFEQEDYAPVVKGLAFSKDTWNRGDMKRADEAPAFHRAPAFPLSAEMQWSFAGGQGSGASRRDQGREASQESGSRPQDSEAQQTAKPTSESEQEPAAANGQLSTTDCQLTTATHQLPTIVHQLLTANHQQPSEAKAADDEEELREVIEEIRKDPDAPKFMTVLTDVFERGAKNGEGGPVFTFEEIEFLASDPEFREYDPEMAKRFAQISGFRDQGPGNGSK